MALFSAVVMAILLVGCPDAGGTNNVPQVAVGGVSLDKTAEQTLKIGNELELVATVTPNNATDGRVTWRSLQPGVAMVFPQGLNATVVALTPGETIIMAVTQDGGFLASCELKVTE